MSETINLQIPPQISEAAAARLEKAYRVIRGEEILTPRQEARRAYLKQQREAGRLVVTAAEIQHGFIRPL